MVERLKGIADYLSDTRGYGLTKTTWVMGVALVIVLIRRKQGVDMTPAVCASAFLCSLIVAPFAAPLAVDARAFGLLALFGVSQFGLGLLLLAIGTPMVSALEKLMGLVLTAIGSTGVIDVDWEGPVAQALVAARDDIARAMEAA